MRAWRRWKPAPPEPLWPCADAAAMPAKLRHATADPLTCRVTSHGHQRSQPRSSPSTMPLATINCLDRALHLGAGAAISARAGRCRWMQIERHLPRPGPHRRRPRLLFRRRHEGAARPAPGRRRHGCWNGSIIRCSARLRDFPMPVVTAINGPAVGIGMSLALMGDLVLAARSAYFLLSFRAHRPGAGWRLDLAVAARRSAWRGRANWRCWPSRCRRKKRWNGA